MKRKAEGNRELLYLDEFLGSWLTLGCQLKSGHLPGRARMKIPLQIQLPALFSPAAPGDSPGETEILIQLSAILPTPTRLGTPKSLLMTTISYSQAIAERGPKRDSFRAPANNGQIRFVSNRPVAGSMQKAVYKHPESETAGYSDQVRPENRSKGQKKPRGPDRETAPDRRAARQSACRASPRCW
jgi:hypothetical protein